MRIGFAVAIRTRVSSLTAAPPRRAALTALPQQGGHGGG